MASLSQYGIPGTGMGILRPLRRYGESEEEYERRCHLAAQSDTLRVAEQRAFDREVRLSDLNYNRTKHQFKDIGRRNDTR